jgi:hypothetical protein
MQINVVQSQVEPINQARISSETYAYVAFAIVRQFQCYNPLFRSFFIQSFIQDILKLIQYP